MVIAPTFTDRKMLDWLRKDTQSWERQQGSLGSDCIVVVLNRSKQKTNKQKSCPLISLSFMWLFYTRRIISLGAINVKTFKSSIDCSFLILDQL